MPSTTPSTTIRIWFAAHERVRDVLLNLGLAVVAWGLGEWALWPSAAGSSLTPIWPPIGLAVAVTFLGGFRLLPGVVLGSFAADYSRHQIPLSVFIALAQAIQTVLVIRLLRTLKFDERLERVRDPVILSLVAGPIGALAAAVVVVSLHYLSASVTEGRFLSTLMRWWLRDWLGITVIATLIFAWTKGRPVAWRGRMAEAAALAITMLLGAQLTLAWGLFANRDIPLAFAFLPFVWWAGLRFGARGAATIVALQSAMALAVTGMRVQGGVEPAESSQVLLFGFLTIGSLSGQLLAAVTAERDDALERRSFLEQRLQHSQQMEAVGRLAGGIAHDFSNLLTAIIGYTEIVLASLDPKDERRADVEEIGRAAVRATELTRQMLAFSRGQVLQPKTIDLNAALAKLEPMLRRVIGEDIVLTMMGRATTPHVRVDLGQLEQVVMNLVVNARDAMPQGGRLTVTTADAAIDDETAHRLEVKPGAYVMLSVADSGVGMPPDVCARVFEPYYTTKDVGKGTGLGLSTAYGVVRQSDGHIAVSSAIGLGTTFRIYLPRSAAPPPIANDRSVEKMPTGTEHILLVEDDAPVRRLAKELLVRLGYAVTEAGSGRAGLALGTDDTRLFDLVLCDVILGDMSGPAVVEALCALRPSIRVLYMSGYMDDASVQTGVLDEGRPFIQKPFTLLQLAKTIREVLDESDPGPE